MPSLSSDHAPPHPAPLEESPNPPGAVTVHLEGEHIIDRNSPVPYYFQLSTFAERQIESRRWQAGELLPSEQELCERLGISRTVVRQAIADLGTKGLIVKQNGKRTMIAFPKYEGGLMQNLRGFYEDARGKGQTPSTKVLEFKITPATGEVSAALRIKEGEPVIMLDRLRSLDGEPEVLVVTFIPERLCPALVREDLSNQSLYELLARKFGLRIARGIRTIEAVSLNRRDASLLDVKQGSPALLLKSIGLIEDGTPLEYFIAKHRGDRAKFNVQLVGEIAGAHPRGVQS
jgi:GntR family transcriptional regulator